MADTSNGNGNGNGKGFLSTVRKAGIPLTLTGVVIYTMSQVGPPRTGEQVAIYMTLGGLAITAAVVQFALTRMGRGAEAEAERQAKIMDTQERIITLLDGHHAQMSATNEILRDIQLVSRKAQEYMATTSQAIAQMQSRLLEAAIKPRAGTISRKRRTALRRKRR